MNAKPPSIPLPERWPERAKSALVYAVALAHHGLVSIRSWCANSPIERVRLAGDNERLQAEVELLREELRIKDARMARVAPAKRPHYAPADRLAILQLQAARGWSMARAARVFLLSAATIASWIRRIDEQGADALVRTREPVNRFGDVVVALVQQLRAGFPLLGKRKLAGFLARAGLHLAASTVGRMLAREPVAPVEPTAPAPDALSGGDDAAGDEEPRGAEESLQEQPPVGATATPTVAARYPGHVWNIDITLVPTAAGFWVPWLPFSMHLSWPFCWHVIAVIDHFSRSVVHIAAFKGAPSAAALCAMLDEAVALADRAPRYTVTDRGTQFQDDYLDWCAGHSTRARFGAVGKKGSIAVIERFFLTLKNEGTRRIVVPYCQATFAAALTAFASWYNDERPHASLAGATPREMYAGTTPAHTTLRLEPRPRYPLPKRCDTEGSKQTSANDNVAPAPEVRRVTALRLRVARDERMPQLPRVALDCAA
jgi:transposase InsO family protein